MERHSKHIHGVLAIRENVIVAEKYREMKGHWFSHALGCKMDLFTNSTPSSGD
jgi:hypothetical protein